VILRQISGQSSRIEGQLGEISSAKADLAQLGGLGQQCCGQRPYFKKSQSYGRTIITHESLDMTTRHFDFTRVSSHFLSPYLATTE
jgi:hypothetical protein